MRAPVENRYLHRIYGVRPKPYDKAHADLDRDIRSVFLTPRPVAPSAAYDRPSDQDASSEDRCVRLETV